MTKPQEFVIQHICGFVEVSGNMLAQQRYDCILSELKSNGSVTVAEISERLGVSAETVRRDLILLETHGKLKRVFGGAVEVENRNHLKTLSHALTPTPRKRWRLRLKPFP